MKTQERRIFLVDGKQVAIIKSNTHTYNVRFVKSGKFMEIKKDYVISYYPDRVKTKRKKKSKSLKINVKKNNQLDLEL